MLLLLAATPLETDLLRHELQMPQTSQCADCTLLSGTLGNNELLLAHGGVGPVTMTLQLTRLLERQCISAVLLCGCGGSYPGHDLKNGDLVLASEEVFGDLGVTTEQGFLPLEQLPLPDMQGFAPPVRQQFPLNKRLLDWACQILPEARCGRFVTVNSCSGTTTLSDQLARRTDAICENMEGAAVAQVCAAYELPLLEIRGISNPTGTREPAAWDLQQGAEVAQRAVLRLLQQWPPEGF